VKLHIKFPPRGWYFGDSDGDGDERPRRGINYFGAVVTRYRVYGLDGEYAIHKRIDHPLRSKPNKEFQWEHADGTLSHNGDISSTDRLYLLETLNGQRKGLLVEGERAADAARKALPASWLVVGTVCGGWTIPDADVLARLARVPSWRLWPDADFNGRGAEHMESIAAYLKRWCSVRTVHWHDAPDHGDAADYLKSHTRGELLRLMRDAVAV
jgi:hypothetical protein